MLICSGDFSHCRQILFGLIQGRLNILASMSKYLSSNLLSTKYSLIIVYQIVNLYIDMNSYKNSKMHQRPGVTGRQRFNTTVLETCSALRLTCGHQQVLYLALIVLHFIYQLIVT